MTVVVLVLLAGLLLMTVVAPACDQWRQRRREVDRCGRIVVSPPRVEPWWPARINDPSPQPRRRENAS